MNQSSIDRWLTYGGFSVNGVYYGAPDEAIAWRFPGCPLLPRIYRESEYGAHSAPIALTRFLDAPSLTNADLDAGFLHQFRLNELPSALRGVIRNLIYDLPIITNYQAVPAGVPLAWLMKLPIQSRTRNVINRIVSSMGTDGPLDVGISCSEFLTVRSSGKVSLVDLLCVMESAESLEDAELLGKTNPSKTVKSLENLESRLQAEIRSKLLEEAVGYLEECFRWAVAETDARTIGDAVSHLIDGKSGIRDWDMVSELKLDTIVDLPTHPYIVLDSWVEHLEERNREIFEFRLIARRRTLREIGDRWGLTRERVRQIEQGLLRQLQSFIESPEGRVVQWRIESLRNAIGTVTPLSDIEYLLKTTGTGLDYRDLLLELAGPYKVSKGWVVLKESEKSDPTGMILERTDDHACIDRKFTTDELSKWGLSSSAHESWLARDGKVRVINGHLVRWDTKVQDKLAFALFDLGVPSIVETLADYIRSYGWQGSTLTVLNSMSSDSRFVRTSKSEWALASWSVPAYEGIASSIHNLLKTEGKPMRSDDVVKRLVNEFSLSESSVVSYLYAPMFVFGEGWVRLRRIDEPYQYPNGTLQSTGGVFSLGPMRVCLLIKVDRDVLRGSGRQLTNAAGTLLDIRVNDEVIFFGEDGLSVKINFPATSISGPQMSSTRLLAESTGAKTGDFLTLILNKLDGSLTYRLTRVAEVASSWEIVSRLTGIDFDDNYGDAMNTLARGLGCEVEDVVNVLHKRCDDVVVKALPK